MSNTVTIIDRIWEQQEKEKSTKEAILSLLNYAETEHKVKFPKDKEGLVQKLYQRNYGNPKIGTFLIDGIVEEWKVWSKYLPKNFFSYFVFVSIKDLFRRHVTGASSLPCLDSYIGTKLGIKLPEIPVKLFTTVNMKGVCVVNGKPIN